MKLSDLDPVDGQVPLVHPVHGEIKHKKKTVTLTVKSRFSEEYYKATREMMKDIKAFDDPLKAEKINNEMLACIVVGWSDDDFFEGEFSKEAITELFNNPVRSWIKDLVEEYVSVDANFFPAAETKSK